MTTLSIDHLMRDLREVSSAYSQTIAAESSAIRTAGFAQAISLQDKKLSLHKQLFGLLEDIKSLEKNDAQRDEIRGIVLSIRDGAHDNKKALELGFAAIERLTGKIFEAMRRAVKSRAASYTASGQYHNLRNQSATMHADRTA